MIGYKPGGRDRAPWPAFVDLSIAILALFILVLIGLWGVKDQAQNAFAEKSKDLDRTEAEFQTCVEEKKQAQQDLLNYEALLGEKLKAPLKSGLIDIRQGRVDIQAALLFGSGQASISDKGENIISSVAEAFGQIVKEDSSFMLMVAGFTDTVPIKSDKYTNWELSAERAVQVTKALIAGGLPRERVFAAGFGPTHPKTSNATLASRAFNRRVEIVRIPFSAGQIVSPQVNP